jgi:hypothetical protein
VQAKARRKGISIIRHSLAALHEVLHSESFEVHVDTQRHHHHLPRNTVLAHEVLTLETVRETVAVMKMCEVKLRSRAGEGTSPWGVRSMRCSPTTCRADGDGRQISNASYLLEQFNGK